MTSEIEEKPRILKYSFSYTAYIKIREGSRKIWIFLLEIKEKFQNFDIGNRW